ncbi:MAG: hypothetical protein Tsb0034_22590 [Ekhidna sp.]
MWYYVQIQGRHAPRFYFREQSMQNFKTLLDALIDGSAVVVSSPYRTDVIFSSSTDQRNSLFKLWSLYLSSPFSDRDKRKFSFYSEREEVLEMFFASLVTLSKVNGWYEKYLQSFRLVCSDEQNNPIIKELIACESFLQSRNKTLKRTPINLRSPIKPNITFRDRPDLDASKFLN